jgi:EAL domain-containing protein (putative c-di-GMP-specific phosphodiesterase class I)
VTESIEVNTVMKHLAKDDVRVPLIDVGNTYSSLSSAR